MKKASTWYLIALAVLNVLFALGTSAAAKIWNTEYQRTGRMLPYITAYALELHWWPYLFFGFAIALALISIFSRWPNSIFYHMLIGILVIESAILLLSQIAFALPSIQMWSNVPDLNYPK